MTEPILEFQGKYRFLSNFHICDVEYEGIKYPTSEAAFQAAKTFDVEDRKMIASAPSPFKAKGMGRKVILRQDWEQVKEQKMEDVVRIKFDSHPDLKKALLDTGDADLFEGNDWGDCTWGRIQLPNGTWVGLNLLGKILMKLRSEYAGRS